MKGKNTIAVADTVSMEAKALFVAERIDLRRMERAGSLSALPLVMPAGDGWAVFFRYGTVVLFSVDEDAAARVLDLLSEKLVAPFETPLVERVLIEITADAREGVEGGVISLKNGSIERLQLIAEILSRSVVLDYYEARVAKDFDSIEPLAESLKRRFFGSRIREPLYHIGSSLLSLHKMVGRVEVTEKPDLLWDHPELERLYARLEDEYEIEERQRALERKLDLISRTAETLLDLIQSRRGLRVEWYIVILIVVEIVLTLYELFLRH